MGKYCKWKWCSWAYFSLWAIFFLFYLINGIVLLVKYHHQPTEVHRWTYIFPKLYTNAMDDLFKMLNWKGRVININDEYISHLRFAYNRYWTNWLILLYPSTSGWTWTTKVIFKKHLLSEPVAIHGIFLEVVQKYVDASVGVQFVQQRTLLDVSVPSRSQQSD